MSLSAFADPAPLAPETVSPRRRELLSPRQLECLSWVQQGKTNWEIGRIMGIGQRTVESYLAIAFERLEVKKRVQAIVRARELGLL